MDFASPRSECSLENISEDISGNISETQTSDQAAEPAAPALAAPPPSDAPARAPDAPADTPAASLLAPPAAPEPFPTPLPETMVQTPTAPPTASIFRIERARLLGTQAMNWENVRAILWVMVIGVALGALLLIPQVHALPKAAPQPKLPAPSPTPFPFIGAQSHYSIAVAAPQRPLWASLLLVIGIGAPLLALALGLLALPTLLWREAWRRRQGELYLAIGRQGLLFFLPGQPRRWFLLPWEHIASLQDATTVPRNGRRARLRTVLWRRLAHARRAFRHGRRLGEVAERRRDAYAPFSMRAHRQQPHQRLQIVCRAPLPRAGYGWLFRLAPFTRRTSASSFLLETGWFEAALPAASISPGAGARQKDAPAVSLHQALLAFWQMPALRAQRPLLPLPRSNGAVTLNIPAPDQEPETRRVDRAAWAALPLVPALSVVGAGIALAMAQHLDLGMVLNVATLCALTGGLGLLLGGAARTRRENTFAAGALLLALAGALNIAYALNVLLLAWPAPFQAAPGEPFLDIELLAGLLILLGAGALALEGAGRPGARPAASARVDAGDSVRAHSAELVLALGLLALGLARSLEDINQAVIANSAATLPLLRNILAEPLLPLAIIGLSYFAPLASPSLQYLLRRLQFIYGAALALLVPLAFILVYRAVGGQHPLPLEWTPLLALALVCGLLVMLGGAPIRAREPPDE